MRKTLLIILLSLLPIVGYPQYDLNDSVWLSTNGHGYHFDFTFPRSIKYDLDGYPPFDGFWCVGKIGVLSKGENVGGLTYVGHDGDLHQEFENVKSKYDGL